MHAYDYDMMPRAQKLVGWLFDTCINYYGVELKQFYHLFLNSTISKKIALGDPSIIMGKSGRELAYELVSLYQNEIELPDYYTLDRTREFWLGWALAYYQWYKAIDFSLITCDVEISSYYEMYEKYHEMDIIQFVDGVDALRREAQESSRLKRLRLLAGMSQRQLADITGVPLRTIQQYEQKAKDINKANVDYMVRISKALNCEITALMEEF